MVLAQVVDPTAAVANGLTQSPLAWGLALALGAVAYLFRTLNEERRASAQAIADVQAKLVETIRADAKEQREILSQVVPLATKLTEGLEILERVTEHLTKE
jgi:hypothetical protein